MNIKDDFTISKESAKENISSWSAALGVALRRLDIFGTSENAAINNILPDAGIYEYQKRSKYIANAVSTAAAIALMWFVISTQSSLSAENRIISAQLAKYDGVEENYVELEEKYSQLSAAESDASMVKELIISTSDNQSKLNAIHNYLNLVILDEVWLKELTFTAPNKIEISGGSTNDHSIVEFIALLNEGEQFEDVDLLGMTEVREMAYGSAKAQQVKNFNLSGTLSDIPSFDFLQKNLLAGELNQGS